MMHIWWITVSLLVLQGNAFVFKEKFTRGLASARNNRSDMLEVQETPSLLAVKAIPNASIIHEGRLEYERLPGVMVSPFLVPGRMPAPLARHFLDLYASAASAPNISQRTVPSWMIPWFWFFGIVQVCLIAVWRFARAFNADVVGTAVKEGVYNGEQKLYLSTGVCGLIVTLKVMSGLAQDVFVPSMPQMVLDLDTDLSSLGLTLQLNWICMSIGALVFGSLSDKYGRRPVMLWAVALFTVTTIGVGTCQSVGAAIAWRCLEGFAEGIWVLCDAVMRDAYPQPDERAKWNGILDSIASFAPMLAPVLGAAIATYTGWRATFLFLTFLGLLVFTLAFFLLPETNPKFCNPPDAAPEALSLVDGEEDSWALIKRRFGQSWFPWAGVGVFAFLQGAGAGVGTNMQYCLQNGRGYTEIAASLYLLIVPICGLMGMTLCISLISSNTKCWPMMKAGFLGCLIAASLSVSVGALESKGERLPFVAIMVPFVAQCFLMPMFGIPIRILYQQDFGKAAGAALAFASTICMTTQAGCALFMTALTDSGGEPAMYTSFGVVVFCALFSWVLPMGFREPKEVQAWNASQEKGAEDIGGKAAPEAAAANTHGQGSGEAAR